MVSDLPASICVASNRYDTFQGRVGRIAIFLCFNLHAQVHSTNLRITFTKNLLAYSLARRKIHNLAHNLLLPCKTIYGLVIISAWSDWWTAVLTNPLHLLWKPIYTLSIKKTVQNCFCQNFVKFPPILIIFGRKMAKRLKLCEVHSFSTSPISHHHATVLNADVPNY